MTGIDIAATGMIAQQLMIDTISHNLSNINTTAFKRYRPEFKDLTYRNIVTSGISALNEEDIIPRDTQIGLGVRLSDVYRINEACTLNETNRQLDLAIKGRGYFIVEMPNNTFGYTRDGGFSKNEFGELVDASQRRIMPVITIPNEATEVKITSAGDVLAYLSGVIEPVMLGQLEIARFVNEDGLKAIGDNMLIETPSSGPAIIEVADAEGVGSILQGFLEGSNCDPILSVNDLIKAQRAFEMIAKALQICAEILKTVNNIQS